MARVQWETMPLAELVREVEAGKQECIKQARQLLGVAGVNPKKVARALSPVDLQQDDLLQPDEEAAQ